MKAFIIAVGSEMLTPLRSDTNSLVITDRLNAVGYDVHGKAIVGDDEDALARLVAYVLREGIDLLVCTGGLGPTADDVTREAVSRVLGLPLDVDARIEAAIRARFAARQLSMPAINARQAMVPQGATVLENRNGTAPGLCLQRGPTTVVLLPGPPREMTPMLERFIADRLRGDGAHGGVFRRVLKITGRTESDVDSVAQPIYRPWMSEGEPIATTILAALGQVELHLSLRARRAADADVRLAQAVEALKSAVGDAVFSDDGQSLEAVVGAALRKKGWRIATAESCTGGLLASRLTDVPGSSEYVQQGLVCYSNRAKIEWLAVPDATLAEHGAVSEPVAVAMAMGVRAACGCEVGVGITGIAGPGGGSADKPVGTVAIAVAAPGGEVVRTYRFPGGRDQVKFQATQAALDLVRRAAADSGLG